MATVLKSGPAKGDLDHLQEEEREEGKRTGQQDPTSSAFNSLSGGLSKAFADKGGWLLFVEGRIAGGGTGDGARLMQRKGPEQRR
jgi:hypothetical protein